MKKSVLILVVILVGAVAQAQGIKIAVSGGFPIGDFSDSNSFVLNADGAYVFDVGNQLAIGPSVSVFHFFGKQFNSEEFGGFQNGDPLLSNRTIDLDDTTFVPIGATARFSASDSFILGVDAGYGIAVAPARSEGGLYYKVHGIYMLSDKLGVKLSYAGININPGTFTSLNLGIELSI